MNPACEVCGPILTVLSGWQQPEEGRALPPASRVTLSGWELLSARLRDEHLMGNTVNPFYR